MLAWRAAEVADLLEITTAAVNSALQRARAQLQEAAPRQEHAARPADRAQREMADRYVSAFVQADIDTLTRLLADEVVLEMPPFLIWFRGRESVAAFLGARVLAAPDRWRVLPVAANGQPAVGAYLRQRDGRHHAHSVQVLSAGTAGVTWIAAFAEPGLFATFGLPLVYPGLSRRQAANALDVAGQHRGPGRVRDHDRAAPPDQQRRPVLGGQVAVAGGDHEHAVAV